MNGTLKVYGAGRISARLLRKRTESLGLRGSVGYACDYAVFVHEDLTKFHPVGKAKFLTGPVRRTATARRAMVAAALKAGLTLYAAVKAAAEFLKTESQSECPVDTGFLKSSAFSRVYPNR